MFAAVYYLAFIWDDALADDPVWKRLLIQYGFLSLVGLCFYAMASAYYDRVEISEHGLTINTLFRPEMTVQWEEIRHLAVAPSVNRDSITLLTSNGSKRNISLFMNGLGILREFLDRKVPLEKWEEADVVLPYIDELR